MPDFQIGGALINSVWKCDVCKRERPDEFISIVTQDISLRHRLPPGTMHRNIKYCNDDLHCTFEATRPYFEPSWWSNSQPVPPKAANEHKRKILMTVVGIFLILVALALIIPTFK